MNRSTDKKSVAVIGGGISGIVASYYLAPRFNVTLYEKNNYIGGHTNTVIIPSGPDQGLAVDTGFIVCNDKTYPLFHRFLHDLQVPTRYADMSFGYYREDNDLQYAGTNLRGIFAQPKNIFNMRYLQMLMEIARFNKRALAELENGLIGDLTLGEYIHSHTVSTDLIEDYLLPMGGAIWSSPDLDLLSFPAETFFAFFRNHGLLRLQERPRWQTVVGGSFQYVRKFRELFQGEIFSSTAVSSISRDQNKVEVNTVEGSRAFDYCVLATHADQSLKLLQDPSQQESEALSQWSYHRNLTVLHTDRSYLPPLKAAWASWNYRRYHGVDGSSPVSVTYHMNRLQGFHSTQQYCVTLNPKREIPSSQVIAEFSYTHPAFSRESIRSRSTLNRINGDRGTYLCGSYFGYGFHEDGVRSALDVVAKLVDSDARR